MAASAPFPQYYRKKDEHARLFYYGETAHYIIQLLSKMQHGDILGYDMKERESYVSIISTMPTRNLSSTLLMMVCY